MTTQIYTLSLHDALPISRKELPILNTALREGAKVLSGFSKAGVQDCVLEDALSVADRKSTRLNSSHLGISYAVFCLKKKNRHLSRREYCGHCCDHFGVHY